ncbi:MAG: sodium-translocating pyrophosphatase [Armatimonadota bacterium]|nr:sodium-translocating pyrophosphatase [Armatimonadota bacterium]MDR7520492.1 sodium-translocating pyrophosphatase [Armatimonadota bacterium]MDR7550670.1 sodium-translocating pyrophosphatase [Armatimonadota bacterium]
MEPLWLGPAAGLAALVYAASLAQRVRRRDPGTPQMQSISEAIQEGAMAFLAREYRAIGLFVAVMFVVLATKVTPGIELKTAVAFVIGAACSVGAGFAGMRVATLANTRTAQAARAGLVQALGVAFPGGAVMGMTVVGLGLVGVGVLYLIYRDANQVIGFSLGASSVALFARVGGGIYTKGADVGADLVGKVEAGIPEDDPRNPAVIADAVGDNVGDVAGMGADLFESYVGSVIAAIAIGAAQRQAPGAMAALLLAGVGILASMVGTLFVRGSDAQRALRYGTLASGAAMAVGSYIVVGAVLGDLAAFWAVVLGLGSGIVIGLVAEYYTSGRQVQTLADAATTGPATVVIAGTAQGMLSTVLPLVVIGLTTILAFRFADFYGIALAAVGMLSITGMTVSVDAYGPIADNSAGIAEMAHLGADVRRTADSLDAAGNTTAAIAKGFAIGSAALTALALFFFYRQAVGLETLNILNAQVIAGLFIGGIVPFYFAALAMRAVGRTAQRMVDEVRRQFREIKGLMEGMARPQYARCVDIATRGALREMIVPGLSAVVIPIAVGIFLHKEALGGLLAGAIVTGVPLALYLANAGGAWDNAKKYIEEGHHGGKGSLAHKAAVIGDTVGDPFKDTAGPALNILIKLMTVVALVFAPLFR